MCWRCHFCAWPWTLPADEKHTGLSKLVWESTLMGVVERLVSRTFPVYNRTFPSQLLVKIILQVGKYMQFYFICNKFNRLIRRQ